MGNRAISISLVISLAAYLISKLLLKAYVVLPKSFQNSAFEPIIGALHQIASILPWLTGGVAVGYLCEHKPLKHGAITGAIYGAALSVIGILMLSMQTYETLEKISQIIYALVFTAKCTFLFALSSASGYLLAKPRRSL